MYRGYVPLSQTPNVNSFIKYSTTSINTLRPRQNGRRFADDTFKHIFMNENVRILINISLKFVSKGLINNIQALVQIMNWRRPGDKPLSEPMMVNLLTHICVTRPQWVKPSPAEFIWTVSNTFFIYGQEHVLGYNFPHRRAMTYLCHIGINTLVKQRTIESIKKILTYVCPQWSPFSTRRVDCCVWRAHTVP